MSNEKIEELLKELDSVKNTIWAYQFEFHDLDEQQRKATIEAFMKKEKLIEAKIKAIEIKEKIKNI